MVGGKASKVTVADSQSRSISGQPLKLYKGRDNVGQLSKDGMPD